MPCLAQHILILSLLLGYCTWVSAQPADCPEPHRSLLEEYKAFHRANKYAPDAQYIVQQCWGVGCQGVGDRIRGTLFLLRVAIQYRKIFLVDWTNPAALTNFLVPNEVDWTITGFKDGFIRQRNTISIDVFNATTYHGLQSEEAIAKFRNTKVYSITGVRPFEAHATRLAPIASNESKHIGSCYFHFLFTLNQTIVELGEARLRDLYGPSHEPYISWHWRHYDVDYAVEAPIYLNELRLTLDCVEKTARSVGIVDLAKKPVLLVTDFNLLRQLVVKGEFTMITTSNITAKHIDKGRHSIDIYNDIFVDIYIMSRSRCMLYSRSGFSKMALWVGGKSLIDCSVDRVACK